MQYSPHYRLRQARGYFASRATVLSTISSACIPPLRSPPLPAIAYTGPIYQTLYAGNIAVFVTKTGDGNNRLEWYQNGLLCDFVSNQPIKQILAMIQQLQLVTY